MKCFRLARTRELLHQTYLGSCAMFVNAWSAIQPSKHNYNAVSDMADSQRFTSINNIAQMSLSWMDYSFIVMVVTIRKRVSCKLLQSQSRYFPSVQPSLLLCKFLFNSIAMPLSHNSRGIMATFIRWAITKHNRYTHRFSSMSYSFLWIHSSHSFSVVIFTLLADVFSVKPDTGA